MDRIVGCTMLEYDSVVSTNDTAKELAKGGCADGTVVFARAQAGGRGQGNNRWHSQAGRGLFFTVVLRPKAPVDIQMYSLLAGVALNSSLRSVTGIESLIKWPNDIYHDGRKIAGILCESGWQGGEIEYVVIGIGVNVTNQTDDFPESLRDSAGSLAMFGSRTLDSGEIMDAVLRQLDIWYQMTAQYGFAAIGTLYNAQKTTESRTWI